jgi:hypothetical protein
MIHVVSVQYAGDSSLTVTFDDDSSGLADLSSLIEQSEVFAALRDPDTFRRAYVDDGAVCWPGDLDVSAERLYALVHALPVPATLEQANANELLMRTREQERRSAARDPDQH